MFDFLSNTMVLLFLGALICWNFPQPPWAVFVQNKIVLGYRKLVKYLSGPKDAA